MAEFNELEALKDALKLLSEKLEEEQSKTAKTYQALKKIFPFEIYNEVREDTTTETQYDDDSIINHFIQFGANEIDLKSEVTKKLEEEQNKTAKTYQALKKIFPFETYNEVRPDVKTEEQDDDDSIINHFIQFGANEIDLKSEVTRTGWFSAEQITSNILTDCRPKFEKIQARGQERPLILSKTFGNYSNIKENDSHNFAKRFTMMHAQSKTVCTWIPKNACSSLRFSFAQANGFIRSKSEIPWIHTNNGAFSADEKDLMNASYTFTILRDPLERLLSYFLDKICHPGGGSDGDVSYSLAKKIFKTSEKTNFESFIQSIYTNPTLILKDIHITPQCNFLIYENYDDYFSLENMEEAKLKIHAKTGIQLEDTREFNSIYTTKGLQLSEIIGPQTSINEIANHLREGLKPHPEKMFTPSLVKKILPLYLGDIVLYGSAINKGYEKMNKWIAKSKS